MHPASSDFDIFLPPFSPALEVSKRKLFGVCMEICLLFESSESISFLTRVHVEGAHRKMFSPHVGAFHAVFEKSERLDTFQLMQVKNWKKHLRITFREIDRLLRAVVIAHTITYIYIQNCSKIWPERANLFLIVDLF